MISRHCAVKLTAHQIRCQFRQSAAFIARPAELDRHVLSFDVASFGQALAECSEQMRGRLWRTGIQESDRRQCRLLRLRRERPCRRAAEQLDEIASFQPIDLHLATPSQGCVAAYRTGEDQVRTVQSEIFAQGSRWYH